MNFQHTLVMEGDCLMILRILSCDIFYWKPMKIFIKFLLALQVSAIFTYLYYFLYKLTIEETIQYFPMFCFTIFGTTSLIQHTTLGPLLKENEQIYKLWNEKNCGDKIEQKIKFESLIINNFAIFNTLLVILTASVHLYEKEIRCYFLLINNIFEDNPSSILRLFAILYSLTAPFFVYCMVLASYQMIYWTQHMKFQFRLFQQCLKNIDGENQNEIEERLKFCIKRHQELTRAGITMNERIFPFVPLYVTSGGLHGIGCMIYLYTGLMNVLDGGSVMRLIQVFTVATLFSVSFWALILSGQLVQEKSEELFYSLLDNEWCTWNVKCRKMLLLFLFRIVQPYKLKFTDTIAINYDLGVAIIKFIFSVVSVYVQMQ